MQPWSAQPRRRSCSPPGGNAAEFHDVTTPCPTSPPRSAPMSWSYPGVAKFHAHQQRHIFACRWLERGGSLAALRQPFGHSSIVTTQRYARVGDDRVRREVERLEMAAS